MSIAEYFHCVLGSLRVPLNISKFFKLLCYIIFEPAAQNDIAYIHFPMHTLGYRVLAILSPRLRPTPSQRSYGALETAWQAFGSNTSVRALTVLVETRQLSMLCLAARLTNT